MSLSFSNDWFSVTAKPIWDNIIPQIKPKMYLEVGSFEGASACYIIDKCGNLHDLTLHCIDTWEGGIEHKDASFDMSPIESRFDSNVNYSESKVVKSVSITKHKGLSINRLSDLISKGFSESFDLIYIDGSHQAPDVLTDAVLGFALLQEGGHMIFDDYLWAERLSYGRDPLRCPKPAVDAFMTIFFRKMVLVWSTNSQVVAKKISR